MRSLIRRHWANWRSGFWFRPMVVAIAIAALAPLVMALEQWAGTPLLPTGLGRSPDTARALLTTIIGSLITVVALTFTLTIVTAQLVSGQFSPRALRGLLAEPTPQVIAGIFIGVELYGLIVLSAIEDETADGPGFVPSLGVAVSIILGVVALFAIIVFVNHTSRVVQLENIASRIGQGTLAVIDKMFDRSYTSSGDGAPLRGVPHGSYASVHAPRPGYVQRIEFDEIAARAEAQDWVVELTVRPGDFVTPRSELARVRPALDDTAARRLAASFEVHAQRDLDQDPGFGLEQLSDIAVRALSPGVNDPTTAVTCIGYLHAALERLAGRDVTPSHGGHPRLSLRGYTFEELLEGRLDEIGRYAATNLRVMGALMDMVVDIAKVARHVGAHERIAVTVAIGRRLAQRARDDATTAADRDVLSQKIRALARAADPRASHPEPAPEPRSRLGGSSA